MHSLFSFFNQDYAHTNEKHACSTPRPLPLIKQQPQSIPLKRKRADREATSSPPDSAIAKRRKQTSTSTEPPAQSSPSKVVAIPAITIPKASTILGRNDSPDRANTFAVLPKVSSSALKEDTTKEARAVRRDPKLLEYAVQKIEAHLNLEILFKHNEHRLIEQEIAKCQIAQEQLRRCRIVPYPGQLGGFENADDIAAGTGLTLAPQRGFTQPQAAAPWGVTDGPYTKHYAHWLLPDPRFDTLPEQKQIEAPSAGKAPSRSARSSEPNSRLQRKSTAVKISTSSSGRESAGPLTIRRASDGVMVKLICKFCGKDNMNSLQGFLNHCRIQHKHDYASHGEALDDCGIPLDDAELTSFGVSGVIDTHPSTTNVIIPPNNTLLVHPLIKENRRESTSTNASSTLHRGRPACAPVMPPPKIPSRLSAGLSADGRSFTASPAAPRLSAFFASKGGCGDMSSLIERMKDRSDYNNILDQLQSDEEEAPPKPSSKNKNRNRGRRSTVHGGASAAREPLTLQLPPHRLASVTETRTPSTSSTNLRTPGPATAATDATMSPWTPSNQSIPARKIPASDISAFTSTFGQHNIIPSSSSGCGSAISSFTLSQPPRGAGRSNNTPHTPVDATSGEAMDVSPTHTAENPGLMTDNDESRSQDEDSDVNMEVEGPSTVRIRTSMDGHGARDEKEV